MAKYPRVLFLSGFLIVVVSIGVIVWFLHRRTAKPVPNAPGPLATVTATPSAASSPALAAPSPEPRTEAPSPIATDLPTPPPDVDASATQQPLQVEPGYVGSLNLIIPVAGVTAGELRDTFADARSEGRVHDAIDIPAPQGTPVLAVADGQIIKLFESERGGTTIYQLSKDKKLVYYYAHLQRYADGLTPGNSVRQGDIIAYVGDTGNAGLGNYHLHFSISIVANPDRYWEGTNINPYPLLHK